MLARMGPGTLASGWKKRLYAMWATNSANGVYMIHIAIDGGQSEMTCGRS